MDNYDEWKLKVPHENVVSKCEECGAEIYDTYYKTNIGNVHYECFEEFVDSFLELELIEGLYE